MSSGVTILATPLIYSFLRNLILFTVSSFASGLKLLNVLLHTFGHQLLLLHGKKLLFADPAVGNGLPHL